MKAERMDHTVADLVDAVLNGREIRHAGERWLVESFEVRQEDGVFFSGTFDGFETRLFKTTFLRLEGNRLYMRKTEGSVGEDGALHPTEEYSVWDEESEAKDQKREVG